MTRKEAIKRLEKVEIQNDWSVCCAKYSLIKGGEKIDL